MVKVISAFVFATKLVHSLFLNGKFQASSHLRWLRTMVCVKPGWKPRRQDFKAAHIYYVIHLNVFSNCRAVQKSSSGDCIPRVGVRQPDTLSTPAPEGICRYISQDYDCAKDSLSCHMRKQGPRLLNIFHA